MINLVITSHLGSSSHYSTTEKLVIQLTLVSGGFYSLKMDFYEGIEVLYIIVLWLLAPLVVEVKNKKKHCANFT